MAIKTWQFDLLDPAYVPGGHPQTYYNAIYSPLISTDHEGKIYGELATDWGVKENGLDWWFTIRKGVKFHNGELLTTETMEFSIERQMRIGASYGLIMKNKFEDVWVEGDKLLIRTKGPYPNLLEDLFGAGIHMAGYAVPKKYIEAMGEKGDTDFALKPIGTGPLKLVGYAPNQYMKFEAFEDYWGELAWVKTVDLKVVPDSATRLAVIKAGEAEIIDAVEGPMIPLVQNTAGLRTLFNPGTGWLMVFFGPYMKEAPFNNVKVREAMTISWDRKAVIEKLYYGAATAKGSIYHVGATGWKERPVPSYDVERAKKLMAEAGYAEGFKFTIHATPSGSSPLGPEVADALAIYWDKIGIKMNVVRMESTPFYNSIKEKRLGTPWVQTSGRAYDGGSALTWFFNSKVGIWVGYADEYLDNLWDKQGTEVNREKRLQLLADADEYILKNLFVLPLVDNSAVLGVTSRVVEWKFPRGYPYTTHFHRVRLKD